MLFSPTTGTRSLVLLSLMLVAGTPCVAATIGSDSGRPTLFSNLGTGGNVYSATDYWAIYGSGSIYGGGSVFETVANPFTVAGSGIEQVGQIDLAVTYTAPNPNTFYASIWTDISGTPGSAIPGAYWTSSTSAPYGTYCALVSITGISGLTLTGGQQYFMVLGPVSSDDSSFVQWNDTTDQSYVGGVRTSPDGGTIWGVFPGFVGSAFDVLGTANVPEPSTLALLSSGIVLFWRSFKNRHSSYVARRILGIRSQAFGTISSNIGSYPEVTTSEKSSDRLRRISATVKGRPRGSVSRLAG